MSMQVISHVHVAVEIASKIFAVGTMWIGKKTIKLTKGRECGDPTDCNRVWQLSNLHPVLQCR